MIKVNTDCHGLPIVSVENNQGSARISLLGANVMDYTPYGMKPILWMSSRSCFEEGKAIRGGIPVCWPWLGAHPSNPVMPLQGFARLYLWSIIGGQELPDGSDEVTFQLTDRDIPFHYQPFLLRYTVAVGSKLTLKLEVTNTGAEMLAFNAALHSYFSINDIFKISVTGLDGTRGFNSLTGDEYVQRGAITFDDEYCRMFLEAESECFINDPIWGRRIRLAKSGSRSTVVWNPWNERAQNIPDMNDDDYRFMVCVEAANARSDRRSLNSGASHTLKAIIAAEPLK